MTTVNIEDIWGEGALGLEWTEGREDSSSSSDFLSKSKEELEMENFIVRNLLGYDDTESDDDFVDECTITTTAPFNRYIPPVYVDHISSTPNISNPGTSISPKYPGIVNMSSSIRYPTYIQDAHSSYYKTLHMNHPTVPTYSQAVPTYSHMHAFPACSNSVSSYSTAVPTYSQAVSMKSQSWNPVPAFSSTISNHLPGFSMNSQTPQPRRSLHSNPTGLSLLKDFVPSQLPRPVFRSRRSSVNTSADGQEMPRRYQQMCSFCQRNGEPSLVYTGHSLRDVKGSVVCPQLRSHVCEICGATGDDAHTRTYCSYAHKRGQIPIPTLLKQTSRLSDGRMRKC